jgi:hypothetical protein
MIFAGMFALRIGSAMLFGRESVFGTDVVLIVILLISARIFIKRLSTEGLWAQFVGYLIVSAALDALAVAFPPLMILVIIWVIYNLKKALDSILQLLPHALCSVVLYTLLMPPAIVRAASGEWAHLPVLIAYIVFSVVYARYASRLPMRDGLFRMATMLLSMPLIALLASSIQAGFRSLFQQTVTTSIRTFKVEQHVRAHVRAGIDVDAYTRQMSKTVIEKTVATHVSSANAGMAGAVFSSKSVDQATAPVEDAKG